MTQSPPTRVLSPAEGDRLLAEIEHATNTDMPRAVALAGQALDDGWEHPRILALVAFQFEEDGRYADAMRLLDRAAGLDPSDVTVWHSVGMCLVKMERRRAAVNAFEHALALDPYFAPAYYGLGTTLEYLGDYGGAREQFERAVRLFPDYADPLAGLATLAVLNGEWGAVRDYATRALALQPFQPAAISALASADLNDKKFEDAARDLRALLNDPALDRFDRPSLHCLLGDALDGLGRYDEAFAEYLAGKTAFREVYQVQYEGTGVESQLDLARRLKTYFDNTAEPGWATPAPRGASEPWPAKGHAFLVGFPRSGTTLLENVLASHPEVLALDERVTLREIETFYLPNDTTLDRLSSVNGVEAAERRATYWAGIRELKMIPDGKVVIDKMPLYTLKLPIIAKLFPGVKILFAQRDPRDVVLSCFRRPFQINAGMYQFVTLEGAALFYDAIMQLFETYQRTLPLDVHVIRYESLVADFEGETRAVCDFLGVDWREGLRDFADNAKDRQIRTPSASQVREGLYTTGSGQWRRYEKHLEPILPILKPWIERFGYEPD